MLDLLDRYLLGEPVSKPVVVARVLAERSPLPEAAPFYRALDAVGTRAADEALIALRLVLAGRPPSDDAVRKLRALGALARAAAENDAAAVQTLVRKNGANLDLPPPFDELRVTGGNDATSKGDWALLAAAVRAAYLRSLD
jgi:hypothetical protein